MKSKKGKNIQVQNYRERKKSVKKSKKDIHTQNDEGIEIKFK